MIIRGVLWPGPGGVGTIRFEESAIIEAPVETVWRFMTDFGTMSQREPRVVKVDWRPPVGAGTVATITSRFLGTRTARYEILEWEPTCRFRARVTSGGAAIDGTYVLAPVEGGRTRLDVTARIEVRGALRLLTPLLSRRASRNGSETIENVRRILGKRGDRVER